MLTPWQELCHVRELREEGDLPPIGAMSGVAGPQSATGPSTKLLQGAQARHNTWPNTEAHPQVQRWLVGMVTGPNEAHGFSRTP